MCVCERERERERESIYYTFIYSDGNSKLTFQVKVIIGEQRDAMGSLLSIDNNDGVVKLDRDSISMLQLSHLCRMPADSD